MLTKLLAGSMLLLALTTAVNAKDKHRHDDREYNFGPNHKHGGDDWEARRHSDHFEKISVPEPTALPELFLCLAGIACLASMTRPK